ncbi:MAG: prolyl oligopeptidase family serine peptidase [Candidatus Binatus sp.]|uniref:alpha/beta hydrolase family protein n=1 Tax=Candidatus Binatus sp. TaxID=2811406 RepID=UPI002724279B|nr:prolyl oligopeptidase family serine peptidase [Candidatus Binatus sp.]MDO8434257.1 prolyl oligopeptidase family serine peptidase [Candidatus Binatus sp.]
MNRDAMTEGSIESDSEPEPASTHNPLRFVIRALAAMLAVVATVGTLAACRMPGKSVASRYENVEPFNFDIALGPKQFHIDGYLTRSSNAGKLPALLVLNDGGGSVERCVQMSQHVTAMGIQVACVDIPGYGASSGPSRFVGQPSVLAARRGLDLLVARPDVDASRLAVWGLGQGAVAAGLLMDYDSRPRALILQSGAYDMLTLWPQAPLRTKLAILREVWPSKRALKQRSVIENLPPRLDCSVLIMHGERDNRMPVTQAVKLAEALRARGARVSTCYFPRASHDLGKRVEPELRAFLRDNLIGAARAAS